jgi:hypothetical protein
MAITDLYKLLFGKEKIKDGDVISMAEHGRVGGLSTGQPFKFVSSIDGAPPTLGNNSEIEYDYTDPTSIVLTQTIGSDTYQQTITIVGTVATEGAWIKL